MHIYFCSHYGREQEMRLAAASRNAETAYQRQPRLLRWIDWLLGNPLQQRSQIQARELLNEAKRWQRGNMGERHFLETLDCYLGDQRAYTLYVNYRFPPHPQQTSFSRSYQADVDGVLFGPHGITLYEVKALFGEFQVTEKGWQEKDEATHAYKPWGQVKHRNKRNPSEQIFHYATIMHAILHRNGLLQVPIYSVVVAAAEDMIIHHKMGLVHSPPKQAQQVPIIRIPPREKIDLHTLLGRLSPHPSISLDTIKQAHTILTKHMRL